MILRKICLVLPMAIRITRSVSVVIGAEEKNRKVKSKAEISKTSNLRLNIEVFKIFNCSFLFSHYFPVTRIALQLIKLFSF